MSTPRIIVLLFAAVSAAFAASAEPARIIFDTDMIGDYDDVGAMAVLHKLADRGECEILATVSSTHSNASVGMIEILNRYYGRPDIPVGAVKVDGVGGGSEHPEHRSHIKYERMLTKYAGWWRYRNANESPDATAVYRNVLAAQPDGSVTVVTVGFLTNLRKLLQSGPDAFSALDGKSLVKAKVKTWYVMGGAIPGGRECNLMCDGASAKYVFENWPAPVVVNDFWFGIYVYAGRKVAALPDAANPVRDIFAGCLPPVEKCKVAAEVIPTHRFCGDTKEGHNCFDQSCVLGAVRGSGSFFRLVRGKLTMTDEKGTNKWVDDPNGPHQAMAFVDGWPRERIAAEIERLMTEPPHAAWNAGAPRIKGARVFGATPGRTFFYAFPTCGDRAGLTFAVTSGRLPDGVSLNANTGVIAGRVAKAGEHRFTVRATNRLGTAELPFTLVIGESARSLTPPLGWTSWNAFAMQVDGELIASTAKAIVDTGLAAHGYAFVNIDSCWQGVRREEKPQSLQPNLALFPDMKGLVDGIHSLGLKAGIYSTPMVIAWGSSNTRLLPGGTGYPLDPKHHHYYFGGCGKVGFEKVDAAQFAAWGFDWLKYDWPNTDPDHAAKMRAALDATGREFILQLCTECKPKDAAELAKSSSLCRGSMDTHEKWEYLIDPRWNILRIPDRWLASIRPGFWYDMDMLAVGPMCIDRKVKAPRPGEKMPDEMRNRFSPDEIEFQYWWWAMLPSPIFLSCDVRHIDPLTLALATNDDLLAINQDYPAQHATFESFEKDTKRLWKRRLSDGRTVLGFFNLDGAAWTVRRDLGGVRPVRDAMRQRSLGSLGEIAVTVPVHGCRVYIVD